MVLSNADRPASSAALQPAVQCQASSVDNPNIQRLRLPLVCSAAPSERSPLAMTRHALSAPTRLIGMVQPVEANADRNLDPGERPAVQRIGCAGRIVSFQETEDGRYLVTLSGLIRFAIRRIRLGRL